MYFDHLRILNKDCYVLYLYKIMIDYAYAHVVSTCFHHSKADSVTGTSWRSEGTVHIEAIVGSITFSWPNINSSLPAKSQGRSRGTRACLWPSDTFTLLYTWFNPTGRLKQSQIIKHLLSSLDHLISAMLSSLHIFSLVQEQQALYRRTQVRAMADQLPTPCALKWPLGRWTFCLLLRLFLFPL